MGMGEDSEATRMEREERGKEKRGCDFFGGVLFIYGLLALFESVPNLHPSSKM